MDVLGGGAAVASGLGMSDLSPYELWVRYLALSGCHSLQELENYVNGLSVWTAHEHDVAAQALNEYFSARGMDHPVAYAEEL
jgi:hypothetical protein